MATGLQTDPLSNRYQVLRVVDGAGAGGVAAPSAATDGVEMPKNQQTLATERCAVAISDRSGSGTLSITYAKIWGYIKFLNKWFPLGTGADADRGKLNEGIALGEVAADDLRLIEEVGDLSLFDRVAVELNAVGGTSPVIDVDIIIPNNLARSPQS